MNSHPQQISPKTVTQSDISHTPQVFPDHALITPPSLASKYRFIREIGHGAQGKIFLAERLEDGIQLAIKQLNISSVKSWKAYDLFHREAETLASLNIDGVAKFYDAIECLDDNPPCSYIVQEYIQGKSLNDMINRGHRFTLNRVYDVIIQTLEILKQLHEHNPPVIHRDIKPSNIMLKSIGGDQFEVYLIDFGAVANPQVQGGGSTVAGTFGYMAPEQMMGKPSPAGDIYSLAAVAVYMISGRSPADMPVKDFRLIFEPDVESMPPALVNTLGKMLDPRIENRFTDISKLIHIFTQYNRNIYELDSSGEFNHRNFSYRLNQFEQYGQNGAIELWQMLPNQTPRKATKLFLNFFPYLPPFESLLFAESKSKVIKMTSGEDAWETYGSSPTTILVLSLIFSVVLAALVGPFIELLLFIILSFTSSLSVLSILNFLDNHTVISYYLSGLFAVFCIYLIMYLKHKYRLVKNKRMINSGKHIPDFNIPIKNHSTERYQFDCKPEHFNHLCTYGSKTIATITNIEYMPAIQDNIESNIDTAHEKRITDYIRMPAFAIHGVPSFLITYKFNPPDDSNVNDLVHSIIIHQDPDKTLQIGDPIPILYDIYKQDEAEYVVSMPFPFPFKDPVEYADIMGVSKTILTT